MRRSYGQRHRRVRSAVLKRATLTLCSRAHGRAAAQRWLVVVSCSSRCRWQPVCLQTGRQYADDNKSSQSDSARSLVLAQVLGTLPGKNERLGPTEPGSAHGQTQIRKRKRENWDRLTANRGQYRPWTPPRHANKDCLTTEENVTITSSRITRQGHCPCGAAESSLVARDHQPTKSRSPQRATGDTRIVACWNLWENVTDDENEWRTAQWRTRKAGRAVADSWRQRKKRQECPSTQSTQDNYLFLALVHGVAVNKFQQISFK